ncbi:hypothetical protein ISF_04213 [Cordyceps fumosorosea ARSEF 2679]|uniref:Uncharacterized protein n=1 Tax=Cordyceps fumosorosea (strain ARSEF 2679) TaxID=1081104 RepID=A0A167XCG9_CORFA|nr:hypothetical protein ISF_04213 [Cordyceps fumosorosea ARSEF 2679]OAA64803.1 hypothetical protein ISF_04213 [Cordyceps fumosorosea ARSEF 2679]
MDGSDGNNPSNGGSPTSPPQQQQQQQRIHPGDSSRAVRAELEARRRATVERQRRYAPGAHEQIGRVTPPRAPTAWHWYVAYSAALGVTVRAPLLAYSAVYEQGQMRKDPRLRALLREGGDDEHGQGGFSPGEQESGGGEGWNDVAQYKASYTGEDTQQQQQQQSSWETYKQTTQQQQTPPPQQYGQSTQSQGSAGWGSSSSSSSSSSSGWDSSDFDDASPVAASAQNAGSAYGNNSSGSAWDRLRRQSQGASPQQQQQQQQRQPPPPPSSSGGWGDSGDGADRAAQDRAQTDFDQLVERDRQGQQGQGRSGWGDR